MIYAPVVVVSFLKQNKQIEFIVINKKKKERKE